MPAFLKKKPGTQRKPAITGKLGVSGVPKLDEMLTTEPPEQATSSSPTAVKRDGAKRGKVGGAPSKKAPGTPKSPANSKGPIVQMSREWVRINIKNAVSSEIAAEFLVKREKVYSRHLIYAPMWLPAAAAHAAAFVAGKAGDETSHRDHDVLPNLHYEEAEVKAAVNKKKANLRAKYPTASTLGADA